MANNKPLWRKCNHSSRFVLWLNGLELHHALNGKKE